ncbi:acetyl-CoA carboxylase biotin carboxyl carrier protein [Sphingobium lignivorans]|uniref:Biotin carboxyl carrier protein of acetyl-CoA carboxylase n=1 Tax=Sphingobium lignivorans TaxID=2735886 RepID=A0ABR6NBJ6_9SPHN|nr:acetyl-CoA carboxylase biotin carboxyl carrier protein [Sphingobium lignivorans]MBB5984650.1 acetyl-CoA carboxylase biotin carboxyl carrier protein [Sphingobium lignivorans]
MSLTAKDVEEIMKLLEGSTFDRLSLEMDGIRLELERGGAGAARPARATGTAPASPPASASAPPPAPAAPPPAAARPEREAGLVEINAPLLGIFYHAPKPGEAPFVDVGSRVDTETVIGIIEVMKLMNSVSAGVSGEVVEIIGRNGELVEHGEVLMLVRPDA